jgi:hypothetical protein
MLKASSCVVGDGEALVVVEVAGSLDSPEDDLPELFEDKPTPNPMARPRTKTVPTARSIKSSFNRMPYTVRCLGKSSFGPSGRSALSWDVM